MSVQSVSQAPALTPRELLTKVEKGECPEYTHSGNDFLYAQLKMLSDQYRQDMTVENKNRLLGFEQKILFDGLEHPELTLARNYDAICSIIGSDSNNYSNIRDILRLFDITGLKRMVIVSHQLFKNKVDKKDFSVLRRTYLKADENSEIGMRVRSFVIKVLGQIKDYQPEYKDKIFSILSILKENTNSIELLNDIDAKLVTENNIDDLIASLEQDYNQPEKLRSLLVNAKANSNENITRLITENLRNDNISVQLRNLTLLGAGKFRSDENFEILKEIIFSKASRNPRGKELALQSFVLYLKDKPKEVRDILTQVSHEYSQYSTLVKILLDKVNGTYHGQKGREFKYKKYTEQDIERYNELKSMFLEKRVPLNTKQENACDRFLLPFRKILEQLVNDEYKFIIQTDTYTSIKPEKAGKRFFDKSSGILNAGDYYDTFRGMNSDTFSFIYKGQVAPANHENQTSHELGHMLEGLFTDSDLNKLKELYKKSLRNHKTLDYYAASNYREYFAQGIDAYTSFYKPHKDILNNNPLAHTRYELLEVDPDLYKFIKKCFKKYH